MHACPPVQQGASRIVWGLVPAGSVRPLGAGSWPTAGDINASEQRTPPVAFDLLLLPHQQGAPPSIAAGKIPIALCINV